MEVTKGGIWNGVTGAGQGLINPTSYLWPSIIGYRSSICWDSSVVK